MRPVRPRAGRAEPWGIADAPADYIERLIGAIIGVPAGFIINVSRRLFPK